MLLRLSIAFGTLILIVSSSNYFIACSQQSEEELSAPTQAAIKTHPHTPTSTLGKAQDCRPCHLEIYQQWSTSHHALANRELNEEDTAIFKNSPPLKHGDYTSTFAVQDGQLTLTTTSEAGYQRSDTMDMVLAYDPLHQYLTDVGQGRWQATELAYDPHALEWFNVFGDENRQDHEWGHWTNRSMNWNANCATCHMTQFDKNYQTATDSYQSTWHEMGISCVQCHQVDAKHFEQPQESLPTLSREEAQAHCASCHSRREELIEGAQPGDDYHDFYRLSLPTQPGLYYPDGQIRDEVFVYGSFIHSKMGGHAGVNCFHCHNAHSGELIMPTEQNQLCMQCHGTGQLNATIIEPLSHSHHSEGSTGNSCIECHMTQTTYMQRDPRRDHGFHIPDPLLTKELGIPNACNKCHQDQSVDWAIGHVENWYGDKMERPERERTRVIAEAYAGNLDTLPDLIEQLKQQTIPAWQATLLELMMPWAHYNEVQYLAPEYLNHESPLVRSAAMRLLQDNPQATPLFTEKLADPSRLVRLDAAWILRESLTEEQQPAYQELQDYIAFNQDQPSGKRRKAQWYYSRGQRAEAIREYQEAIASWEANTPLLYQELAIIQSEAQRPQAAIKTLLQGLALEPQNAYSLYLTALAYREVGQMEKTQEYLLKTVSADPNYTRAWYNLGLVYAQNGNPQAAINAISKAGQLEPNNLDFAYALATIYAQANQIGQAQQILQSIIATDPNYQAAYQLLQQIQRSRQQ